MDSPAGLRGAEEELRDCWGHEVLPEDRLGVWLGNLRDCETGQVGYETPPGAGG